MDHTIKKHILTLQGFYLFAFFGVGSLFPLLSVYLSEVEQLSGYQIGTIMSIGPITMIFFQPIWGIICDVTSKPAKVLSIATAVAGVFGIGYVFLHEYLWLIAIAVMIAIFQSAIIPVSDSIALKYTSKVRVNYGNIRLFGSLGFGVAVFVMGHLSEGWMGPRVIFYAFFLSLLIASLLALHAPKEKASTAVNIKSGMKELLTMKKFLLFLAITFLVFGPNLANNTYFGLFVEDSGGTYTGIGIAFMIAVLSEIPFMRVAGNLIARIGLLPIATLAGIASLVRWIFYFTEPSLWLVYSSAVIQGLSIGLFIPAGLQYIKEITPSCITVTAITVYAAIGNGLGNWFSTFAGGLVYDSFNIYGVYLFFAALSLLGVVLSFWLMKLEKETLTFRQVQES